MNETEILDFLYAILPALIIGAVAFFFFQSYFKNEEKRRHFQLLRENRKTALPIRLQAYERMALFLERIAPGKILFRVQPTSEEADAYSRLLIANIEQEFEHNIAQQVYITAECWDYIRTAKNATINMIRNAAGKENIANVDQMRELILTNLMEKQSPTDAALAYIKKEVKNLI
ncbi:hypothetical protein C7S20_11305 [Christiangramia fulva]|uniref:Uncharacterized protein n=1 Tax=Christiangramia fulva TaxID=2126553 RepID=A0A2R3Z6A4_9FLAO|nr:hypothetical protein [Christiangramia fulva]AVR45790.1 hypothetical protein C7S20_11305 [Christiangramia fulva]